MITVNENVKGREKVKKMNLFSLSKHIALDKEE